MSALGVLILLHRPADHPRAAQALRSAVGYLLADLRVTVVFCGAAAQILTAHRSDASSVPAPLRRHLTTLEALGQALRHEDDLTEDELAALARAAHATITW